MQVSVYSVNLSFDENETTLDEVLSSLNALIDYACEAKLGYNELASVQLER